MKKKRILITGIFLSAVCLLVLTVWIPGREKESEREAVLTSGENSREDHKTEIGMEGKIIFQKGQLEAEQKEGKLYLTNGRVKIICDINTGLADLYKAGEENPVLSCLYAETLLEDGTELKSSEMVRNAENYVSVNELEDGFGRGVKVSVENKQGGFSLFQNYYMYEDHPYLFLEAAVTAKEGVSTNYIAPVMASKGDFKTGVLKLQGEDERFIFTPFDNDAYVRFSSMPLYAANESYEVTAVFDNVTRSGIVTGSVTHDTWKTGIKVKQGGMNETTEFKVYGGITSVQTRDTLPHGYVKGLSVTSPKIFFGFYEDYRDGLEEYGRANAVVAPPLKWEKGIPMGWNSWSAVADKVNYDIYTDSSDFVKEYLQNNSFSADGVVYINFDSFWDNLTESELKEAAQYVIDNGQIPGIYTTPFTFWGGGNSGGTVEGTGGKYSWYDLLLKDEKGTILPAVDGGISIDPTHPGNILRLKYQLDRFREWGFRYVKLDFMTHGAREGVFYKKDITTGVQAYNYGMEQLLDILGEDVKNQDFFISLSIAPIFPSQYAHSRRISCDVFGTVDNSEYMLNSLTYGWWMNGTIYPFNDPDHIVVYNSYNHREPILFNEGLTRYISAAISGTMMIDSDDFRIKEARERAVKILTNEEINQVAKDRTSFRPAEGDTKDRACDTFVRYNEKEKTAYLAVFNFSAGEKKDMEVDLSRIGLEPGKKYKMYDLWSKTTEEVETTAEISLDKAQSKIFRIYEQAEP